MVATGMGITIFSDMVNRPWSLDGHRIDLKTLDDEAHTVDVGMARKRTARGVLSQRAKRAAFPACGTALIPNLKPSWFTG